MDAQRLAFMRKGLQPPPNYVVVDGLREGYDPFASSDRMAFNNKMFGPAPQPGFVEPLKDAKPLVMVKPEPRKRKTSVEGETVEELTENIIKDQPSIALVTKAFKKMAEMMTEQRDLEFLNNFE